MSSKFTESPFEHFVRLRYQIYNSLFLTLPFDLIHQTGTLLPLLSGLCEKMYREGVSPVQIVERFFDEYQTGADEKKQADVLFNFIKYIERQVVLFDAVEEAAFAETHEMDGPGTVHDLFDRIHDDNTLGRLIDKLEHFSLRIILTAHPTQFYPGPVLGIITDLANAIRTNDLPAINELLLQLGKTPFINRQKPTPLDEARSLIWYLEHVFYDAVSSIIEKISTELTKRGAAMKRRDLICMGFWPGGDRDGNPFVNATITRQTVALLRRAILNCYYRDVRILRRRLTFQGVHERITDVEYRLFDGIHQGPRSYQSDRELLDALLEILHIIETQHDGLFADLLKTFITRVRIFGFHFATLDIRQDSRKHEALLETIVCQKAGDATWSEFQSNTQTGKIDFLTSARFSITPEDVTGDTSRDIIESILAIRDIQNTNGARACHRYIISNSRHTVDIMTLLALIQWTIGDSKIVDVVPLFETIDDLRNAGEVMETLYNNPSYREHLEKRQMQQTIMLGFSDGTKDGGYVRANWSILTAKETLTRIAAAHGVRVLFFDGRGGPPSRGGGNTHKFYSSLGPLVANHEVQLTIQGQTVSSNFGSHQAAVYNIEQLFSAGIESTVFPTASPLDHQERELLNAMAETSYQSYSDLKHRPEFLKYLQEVGTLDYYGSTKIGSRPVKRGQKSTVTLDSLRAIPFTGSWSQMKQNVPGYYGFGAAIKAQEGLGHLDDVAQLYQHSRFFQTLVGNSMQSLSKSFFPLTAYLASDQEFGKFWNALYYEYQNTVELLLKISGQGALMDDARDGRMSIQLREQIVLPLLTIQHAALQKIRSGALTEEQESVYRKIVLRTMYGIINAGRNVA